MSVQVLDSRIEELNKKISDIENRPTEVYSRIVGYYRAVKNWNNGKSEEYKVRKTFLNPDELPPCNSPLNLDVVVESVAPAEVIRAEVEEKIESNDQVDLFSLASEELAPEQKVASAIQDENNFSFFFRNTCPNCPPMKEYISTLNWKGTSINVDEEEGLNAAVENNVFTAPTVILFSPEGTELFRTDNVNGLKDFIENESRVVAAV